MLDYFLNNFMHLLIGELANVATVCMKIYVIRALVNYYFEMPIDNDLTTVYIHSVINATLNHTKIDF